MVEKGLKADFDQRASTTPVRSPCFIMVRVKAISKGMMGKRRNSSILPHQLSAGTFKKKRPKPMKVTITKRSDNKYELVFVSTGIALSRQFVTKDAATAHCNSKAWLSLV